jgi:hypothetical protein
MLTLTWLASTITLPNCVVDLASLRVTDDGIYSIIKVLDRRELWKRVVPISGEYTTLRAGSLARQMSLRSLGTILMTALGEASAVVSALPIDVYPPVSWRCDDVVEVAEALFTEYGYTVALGFGSEAVTVVKLGTGATLSTSNMFAGSDTLDPKLTPRYMRNCFGDSVAQVRLKMEAVGLDTDGQWYPIDELSFTPGAGWSQTPPYTLSGAIDTLTDEQKVEANAYVRSAYRVMGFADGTWDVPDGSETLATLDQILPIDGRLLGTEDLRPDESYKPLNVYGQYLKLPKEKAQPALPELTLIGDRVVGLQYKFDGESGLLLFDEPIFYVDTADYFPADLWIEVTIRIRSATTGSWRHYEYDVETASGMFVTTASQHIIYNQPDLAIRCDGAIIQVNHVMTTGEYEHAVNRTTASRNFEFDKKIPSRAQRVAHLRATRSAVHLHRAKVEAARVRDAND